MTFTSPLRPRTSRLRIHKSLTAVLSGLLGVGVVLLTAQSSMAEVPSTWSDVAHDGFGRTSANGWGSADLGGTYTVNGPAATSGSSGTSTLSAGTGFAATLSKVSAADVDVSDTFALQGGSASYNLMSSWIGRKQADGSQYNASVSFSQTGRAVLGVSRVNGSSSTWLEGIVLPFTVTADQSVRGDLQITGTNPVVVRARAWKASSSMPAWQIQHSDNSTSRISTAGAVGVRNYVWSASSPVKISHDDLSVGANDGVVPAPSPAIVGATQPARGTTVGSQAYAIPAGALFVDGRNGSDGASGTATSPLKTVGAAVAKVATGGTVVVRAGTYHESITGTRTVTIQNYPNEAVWFDGSVPVPTWTRSGSTWVSTGWKAEFDSSMGGAATKARYIHNNPMAADADQVFLNGAPLTQVGSAGEVTAGKFAVNDGADTITIGSDPSGQEVRASDLKMAFRLSGPGSVIQGVGVRRYATTWDVGAAVRLGGPGGVLRQMVITDNAMQGIALSNRDKTVDHVVATKNGQLGVGGTEVDNSTIKNSVISDNNTQDFKDAPVSGGIKITRSRVITVSNNDVKNNQSAGIWFDASCYQVTAVNNDVQYNRSTQIEVEVSGTALIANNTTYGGTTGILIYDTSDARVYNNKIGDNSIFGIKLAQDVRRQSDPSVPEAHDQRQPIPDPTVTWITKNVSIVNNVFGNSNHQGGFQFYALDGETNRSADSMNITIDGNLFVKRINKSMTEPCMVAWGQGDNHTLVRYETPTEFKAKNSSWNNAQAPDSFRITAMDPYITQFGSVAKQLPSDIAAAMGLASGTAKLGTYRT